MNSLGVCSVTFRQFSIEEVVQIAKEANVDGIEWGGDQHVPVLDVELAKKAYELTHKAGLTVLSYGSYYKCGQDEKDRIQYWLNNAKYLHTTTIRIWAGKKGPNNIERKEREELIKNIQEICDVAAKDHFIISLEYHRKTLTETIESALQLVKEVGKDNLRCQWQLNPEKDLKCNLRDLEKLANSGVLGNIHVQNMRVNEQSTYFGPLEQARDQWKAYYDLIQTVSKKDRNYIIEFCKDSSIQQFKEDAVFLKSLII